MKKILVTVAFLLSLSSLGYCQFAIGRLMAGGSFSAASNTSTSNDGVSTSKSSSISFDPQVGYFFATNFAAGAGLELSRSTIPLSGNSKLTTSSVLFAPFTRYYFDRFYGQATFHAGSTKSKSNDANSSTTTVSNVGWSLAAGYAYMLNEYVAIEPQIGYKANYLGSAIDGTYGTLFLSVGIQAYLGK